MNDMHKADIELSVKSGESHIKIGGREIEGVTKVVVSQAVGEIPQITLDLLIDSLHIAAEGELNMPPEQRYRILPFRSGYFSHDGLRFNRPRGWNPYDGCHE